MGGLQSRIRLGNTLALLALVLQLVLTFGHVHVARPETVVAASSEAGARNQTAPSQPDSDDEHDHYCAIYAVLALLAGAQIAEAPALAMPATFVVADLAGPDEAVRVAPRRTAFRSRAPPLS